MSEHIPDLTEAQVAKFNSPDFIKLQLMFHNCGMGTAVTPMEVLQLVKFVAQNWDRVQAANAHYRAPDEGV